jgi:hypothetical protein
VEKGGKYTSDECFKMALTDAISVAAKALGVGGSVYSGGERTKYSAREDTRRYEEEPPSAPAPAEEPKRFVCECCGKEIKPYIGTRGQPVSLRAHAERSRQRFGKVLCLDCMPAD